MDKATSFNQDTLNKWFDIPRQVLAQVDTYAPMLELVGYRIDQIPMNYTTDLYPALENLFR